MVDKLELYKRLASIENAEEILYQDFSEVFGISIKSIAGHVTQAKTNENIFNMVVESGENSSNIANWF